MVELVQVASLAVVLVFGVVLTYFAYEIAQPLLRLAGAVGGLAVGVVVGFLLLPRVAGVTVSPLLLFGVSVVTAVVGSLLLPALGRIAFGITGFVATALATLVVFTEGRAVDALLRALPADLAGVNPTTVVERFVAAPVFRGSGFDRVLLVAAALGLVGGGVALLYYDVIVGLALTGVGAVLLSIVVPALLTVALDGVALSTVETDVSPPAALAAFVTGVLFQAERHADDIDRTPGEDYSR